MSTRQVADHSERIAETEGNPEFCISNGWLTQIENSKAIPGIYKLYSLSIIYRIKITELFLLFGIDLTRLYQHQLTVRPATTQLTMLDPIDLEGQVSFPVRFDPTLDLRHTNLLSRMVQVWGQVPVAILQGLDVRHNLYGYIGLEDHTLYPILRPGSFVQIDPTLRKILRGSWTDEHERPIYCVELRDGYCCSWCEMHHEELLLLPHPLSRCKIRRFIYGVEAEIIGRVTGAGISFMPPANGAHLLVPAERKA
jgi:transcriptional regulator with XRE-family HTH domain